MKYLWLLVLVSACGWPINPDDMPQVLRELGRDPASGCLAIAGRGGAATVATPMPVVPGGAYGSGEVLFARANAPGTKVALSINGASCVIERAPDPPTTIITVPEGSLYHSKQ